jgi:uncharacterized membrane protein YcaP (DUF421 family)
VFAEWIGTTWAAAGWVLATTVAIFLSVLIATRVAGLRSFSKMSSFDFAMTVAVGSVMASTATSSSVPLSHGLVALGGLYGTQVVIARLRLHTGADDLIDNTPMVLMVGNRLLHDHLRAVRISESDVRAKLREANVLNYDQVVAVVLETTGDISVLHGDESFDPDLLRGVIGAEQLR